MNEKVTLRVFSMPCCKHQLCWVNPRLPNYCPECGAFVYANLLASLQHTVFEQVIWLREEAKSEVTSKRG